MADSIRVGRKNFFASAFAEFTNGAGVVRNVPATLHVDLSTSMVYVADLLRLCSRDGDFYFFSQRDYNFTFAADNLRVKFIFLDNPVS